jgi:pimeloyl-ACP methyl ester carboxylesterase
MPFEFPMRDETRTLTSEQREGIEGDFIQLKDGTVHYEIGGPEGAPVVVLVHGFSVPYFIWDPTFDALVAAGFRVLRYDLFGRGYSDRPHLQYDLACFTRQLTQLLDALDIEKCRAVCGLSLGGLIAADFAVQQSDRIEKLVLVDPAGFPVAVPRMLRIATLPLVGELTFSLISQSRLESLIGSIFDPSEVALVIDRYRPQMEIRGFRRAILSTFRAGVAENGIPVYRHLGQISGLEIFLVWGTEDKAVPFHFSKVFLSLVPETEFKPIEGAGHIPHYQQAEEVTPLLMEFLSDE